jgi:uncharacterized protein (DUF885 family)
MTAHSLCAVTLLGLCVACKPPPTPPAPPAAAPEAPAAPDVAEAIADVFEQWFEAQPVTATAVGDHTHDMRWPDLSTEGLERDRTRIEQGLAVLDEVAQAATSLDERIDLDILQTELRRQAFEHEVEQPWRRDPMWYAQLIGAGIDDLISRDFAPLAQRAASIAARLEGLPPLVERAVDNLQPEACMLPHTEVAVAQLTGALVLIEQVVVERTAQAPEPERQRIEAAATAAAAAVRKLRDHVDQNIRPVANGSWRLGEERFARKLALTLQTRVSPAELRRVAILEHGRVRMRMAELSSELGHALFGPAKVRRIRASARGDADAALVHAVLTALAENRVEPDALRDAIAENLERLHRFVHERNIVPMDEAEVLEVIWTPEHQRGVYIAGLAAPAPLDAVPPGSRGLPSFYLVQPIPDAWSAQQRESFLREYNNFMLEILSIHEAIPGHFVQLYHARRHPSRVRKVLASGPFVEGWAVYTEKVMVDEGYAGSGPPDVRRRPRGTNRALWALMQDDGLRAKAIALHGLKFYLRTVTNAILDHGVHVDGMSQEDALDLMIERSFQTEGEARGKWIRAQVTSTQLSTYFVGAQAWLRLRKRAEMRANERGEPFELASFHEAALRHGAPPPDVLPALMGWEPANVSPAPSEADHEGASSAPHP